MKISINNLLAIGVLALTIWGCEKDEDQLVLKTGAAPNLSASSTSMVLMEDNAASEAVALAWDEVNFGYDAAVVYTLEIDTAGDNFVKPYSTSLGAMLEKSYTVGELNSLLTRLKFSPEEAHDLPVRIKASVSSLVDPVYSNIATLTVTPYSTYIEPGYIYVPGAYQDWNPETAARLTSVENNGIYEGFVSYPAADKLKFKFTAERNWSVNYGGGSSAGTLSADNAPDLEVPKAGTYKLQVNLNTMTWTATPYAWAIIGDATPNGWSDGPGADTDMFYDHTMGVWKVTSALTANKFKFRLNDDWGVNYGDNNTSDNLLDAGGADIQVAEAGTYLITLDVENEDGTATYTMTKQ